jgi:hypothetical protein
VLAITSYAALDVFIGLAFLYFLLSVVCSSMNEGIATALNLRAKTLEAGIRKLLGDQAATDAFYGNWRIKQLCKPSRILFRDKKPSYIPSRAFALAILDAFAPDDHDRRKDILERVQDLVDKSTNPQVKRFLEDALTETKTEREKLLPALERPFNQVMERASGWYKRRVQVLLFVLALALASAINADSFVIGQRLWKNDVLRTAVAAQAQTTVSDKQAACVQATAAGTKQSPAQVAGACFDQVKQLDLPLGWSKSSSPSTTVEALAKAIGILLTAFALTLGAPFWFDTLSKLAQLRGTGRASADPSTPEGATTTTAA